MGRAIGFATKKTFIIATAIITALLLALVYSGILRQLAHALSDQDIAYAFNENTGTAIGDSSGNGRNATATSTTWTTSGRYGNALTFNGTSSRVRYSTNFTATNFTLMAWINNPSNQSWESIVTLGQNRDLYLTSGVPSFHNGSSDTTFGSALSTNTWHHVAVTYDGTNLRVYVGGTQVGSSTAMSLSSYSGNVQVGAWINGSGNGDYFSGTIDEVRVYDRALSATEIATDRDDPIGADTTAPTLSNGAPTGTLAANTTSSTLQVTTNENATCRYGTTSGVAYASMTNTFSTTGGTSHSQSISGLTNNTSYNYYVRCIDAASNANASDYTVSFSVAADTAAPTLSNGAPSGTLSAGTMSTNLTLTTNEAATCRYGTTSGTAYGSMTNTFSTTGSTSHSTNVTGLSNGGSYTYYVRCIDGSGNANSSDYSISFSVAVPDSTAPTLSNGSPSGALSAGTTSTNLQVTTDESATCRYSTTSGTAYGSMTNTFSTTGSTSHSTSISGLTGGNSYTYYVRCIDASSNANASDYSISFSVTADTTAPTVSVTAPSASSTVSGTISVTASASDNVGVVGVQFQLDGNNLGSEDTSSPYSVSWDTTSASAGTHTLTAIARDAANNQTTATNVSVTVNNSVDANLLVGYAFNENTGTTSADVTANGNTATLTSTTWTTSGRYGNGLTYNGTSSRSRSGSNVTMTNFTIEGWVNNPSNQSWESIVTVGQNRDLYLTSGVVSFYNGSNEYTFGSALSTNTWHHVAVTYDGTNLRAYVNGTQVGNNQSMSLSSYSGPVQVGAWINGSNNGDWFSGSIDEVRVYSRALSASEIASDRDTAIGSGGPDTTAPTRSAGAPTGTLSYGTTSTNLTLTTNENATCRYSTTASTAYASMGNTFSTTGTTSHSTSVSSLTNGSSYTYYVRCIDGSSNANTDDYSISFSVSSNPSSNTYSMRFFGNGDNQIDRVEIPLTTNRTVDVGGNMTIEFWMRTGSGNNSGNCASSTSNGAGWINGNIIVDRDVFGGGDNGDYGISVYGGNGRIAFGVENGNGGATLCSTVAVNDGNWHHVAVTRNTSTGGLAIYIDGTQRGTSSGPTGDISYRDGRSTSYSNDPYLVFGAEKHDAGSSFPSYSGWLDEVRISNSVRYTSNFTAPSSQLSVDGNTVAYYRFNEGSGTTAEDETTDNDGNVLYGGNPAGPIWSTDVPF